MHDRSNHRSQIQMGKRRKGGHKVGAWRGNKGANKKSFVYRLTKKAQRLERRRFCAVNGSKAQT
jgi:hypothetical protein